MTARDLLDEKSQEKFEHHLFALMASGDLHFPKGVVHPDDTFVGGAPARESALRGLLRDVAERLDAMTTGWRLVLQPAFAYLVVLGLLYPAYLGLFGRPTVITRVVRDEQPTQSLLDGDPIGAARHLALGAGATRGQAGEPRLQLSRADEFVMLSFLVPITADLNVRYDVAILDDSGQVVTERPDVASSDALGNFFVGVRSRLFGTGRYVLQVRRVNRTTAATERQHDFTFQVVRPAI